MRVIDVSQVTKLPRITALSYGASRSGKTRFAASWPRPLFLADATESGWTTISNMDRSVWFERNRVPIVWAIEKVQDMFQAIADAAALVARGEVATVVVDSLTFYSDLYLNFVENSGARVDQRQLFGKLASHLKTLREQIHLLGCNVVWLALVKEPNEDTPIGGPMLSGQNAAKFSAGCDYVFYHRAHQAVNSKLSWEIRTKRFQNYAAGGRDEGMLSDPLGYLIADEKEPDKDVLVPDCSYRVLAECLGIIKPLDEEVVPEPIKVAPKNKPAPVPQVSTGQAAAK